ncbi:MAG TPA: T9SS type A sorting domain-containing protein [Candidatus Kapabacteria bacterium]|nr:T9SS type A sorting domain-containing protein [Candidatus Kapabacteria bacterium]
MRTSISLRFATLAIIGVAYFFAGRSSFAQVGVHPALPAAVTPASNAHYPPVHHPLTLNVERSTGVKSNAKPQQVLGNYDSGDPTPDEQMLLECINRARANPDSEGIRLFNTTDPDVSSGWDYWIGQGAAETRAQVKADFATYPARPPLAFNKNLITAARGHSQDMLTYNYQGHTNYDGTTFPQRMDAAGFGAFASGENVDAYGHRPLEINESFEIDWGPNNVGVLGHRQNTINYTGSIFTEIGIGMIDGTGSGGGGGDVGPVITTEDYIEGTQNYVLGVVYDDQNHNLFYDAGEGLAGVTITVTGASYSAVTSTSGGYAIPIDAPGNVTVTASGGGLSAPITKQVSVGSDNVKVDFIKDYTGFPYQPTLITPIADTLINTDTAFFVWNSVAGATKYRIQCATDTLMKKLVLNDSTLSTTMRTFVGVKDTTKYYWRAAAKNDKGWGQYSLIETFSVALPPNPVTLVFPKNGATIVDSSITLLYTTSKGALSYLIDVAKDKNLTNIVTSDNSNDTTDFLSVALFDPSTTYYWRVRPQNDNGIGAASPTWSFSTAASGVAVSPSLSSDITISPNPSNGETHIRFSLANTNDVSLKIFDITGKEIKRFDLGTSAPNTYDLLWDASKRSPGVYPYELTIGSQMRTGRIMIVK